MKNVDLSKNIFYLTCEEFGLEYDVLIYFIYSLQRLFFKFTNIVTWQICVY